MASKDLRESVNEYQKDLHNTEAQLESNICFPFQMSGKSGREGKIAQKMSTLFSVH